MQEGTTDGRTPVRRQRARPPADHTRSSIDVTQAGSTAQIDRQRGR